jgi:hypothetical protein
MAVEFSFGLGLFFSFLILYTVGRTAWTGGGISPSLGHYLHRTTQTQSKGTQTFMPRLGFEPTIPVFKRVKTFYASDRVATLIVLRSNRIRKFTEYVLCNDL